MCQGNPPHIKLKTWILAQKVAWTAFIFDFGILKMMKSMSTTLSPTCESEGGWENDVDSCAVDVKHDAEVNGYTAEHRETVNERPVGGV